MIAFITFAKFDSQFGDDFITWCNKQLLTKLSELGDAYTDQVNTIMATVEATPANEISNTVIESKKLEMLTQSMLDVLKLIEEAIDEFESTTAQQKIFVRQMYNIAKFKMDITMTAPFGDFYGRANYAMLG